MSNLPKSNRERRILIAGGGTGGHVYPALATIEALQRENTFRFLYIGGKQGIETRIVPKFGIALETLWIAGIARSLSWKNVLVPFKLLASLVKSWQIVRRFNPEVAVGTGGYVSGPILFVAARLGVPVLIQEQDVYPGLTTRLLARYANRICLAFEAARRHFPGQVEKLVVTGNPVRGDLLQVSREAARREWKFSADLLTLFVFGGSQGARSINQALLRIIPELLETRSFQVLWQTGERQFQEVVSQLEKRDSRIHLLPYVQRMNAAYAAADIVVCRAGAITLAELAVVAKPAILVPYPHAAGNHQEHNSRTIAEAGAAIMVTEGPGWETALQGAIERLLAEPQLREEQRRAWQPLARPQAARDIGREILQLLEKR